MPKPKRRPQPASLGVLRKRAPRQDRSRPELADATPRRSYADSLFAGSAEELLMKCGRHGEAALADVHWCAIGAWLMHGPDAGALTNDTRLASTAVMLCRYEDRVRLNFPHAPDRPHTAYLADMSPDAAAEARRAGAETMTDWERAGRPYLAPKKYKSIHETILANTRDQNKEQQA